MVDPSTFPGIPGYRPVECRSPDEVAETFGDEFERLLGRTVERVWVVWDASGDEWFPDGPVIVAVGNRQVEVSALRLDALLLSTDAIDRRKGLDPYDGDVADVPTFDLRWVENPPIGEIDDVLGREVRGIGAGEYAYEHAERFGGRPWLLHSIEFDLAGAHLAVENGLDENSLRFEPDDADDFRVAWLARP